MVYECSVALVSLSQAPTAIRAAANCFTNLLVSHTDNNVKLIVLDRIADLKERHREVMQEMLMDVLRALSSPNLDLRQKTLDIALDMLTSKNVAEVVSLFKKELMKTQDKELESGTEYRSHPHLYQCVNACVLGHCWSRRFTVVP